MAFTKDRESRRVERRGEPRHQCVSNGILDGIEDGRWNPGERIPSEDRLAEAFGCSLGTIQRALRSLAEMGVVERKHGSGTFVLGARAQEHHLHHFRFRAQDGAKLLPIFFRTISVERTDDAGPWSRFFGPTVTTFLRLQRLVSVNDEFDLFSEVYLPAPQFDAMAQHGEKWLDGLSIRDVLTERFNAPTLATRDVMRVAGLPPRVCRAIDVPAGTCGMIWTIEGRSYRDARITWQRVFVPPSDRELEVSTLHSGEPLDA